MRPVENIEFRSSLGLSYGEFTESTCLILFQQYLICKAFKEWHFFIEILVRSPTRNGKDYSVAIYAAKCQKSKSLEGLHSTKEYGGLMIFKKGIYIYIYVHVGILKIMQFF